jgi:hypothetical protein
MKAAAFRRLQNRDLSGVGVYLAINFWLRARLLPLLLASGATALGSVG